jgi:catechol 2,3-dioxygenase-like lactoylglutathione lyase family enzyme
VRAPAAEEADPPWWSGLMGFVGVADLDAAQHFYGEVLGLELRDERPFALVTEVGGAMLRITKVPEPAAAPYTVLGWAVDDIAATVEELAARGVVFTRYEGMGQDDRGVWDAPGGGRIAWFLDPDRNNLSLAELPR